MLVDHGPALELGTKDRGSGDETTEWIRQGNASLIPFSDV